jgi:hypothetical protein
MGFHGGLNYSGIHTVREITAATFTVTADMSGDVLIIDRVSGDGNSCTITLPSTTTTEVGFQITIINKTEFYQVAGPGENNGVFTIAQESDGNDILYGGIWAASSQDNKAADFFANAVDTKDIVLGGLKAGAGTWFELTLMGTNAWQIIGTTVTSGTPATPFV